MARSKTTKPRDKSQAGKTLGGYHYIDGEGQRRWHALPCIVIEPDLEWIEMMTKRKAQR